MDYIEQFETIARKFIKREGLESLLNVLSISDFYTAPASSKYHDSEKYGLVKHSIRVFTEMETELHNTEFDMESIAIVSLFHDLCKIGYYKEDTKNVKENGVWKQVPYYSIDDKIPLGHGEKSVILIMQHMKLTTEEIMAIRWHMAGFEPKENYMYMSKAYEEFPLCTYLSNADMRATYIK